MRYDPATPDPSIDGLAGLAGMARRSFPEEPDLVADMLEDVERAVTELAKAAALLRSICDDYDGGIIHPLEAMVAVRSVVRALPWAEA